MSSAPSERIVRRPAGPGDVATLVDHRHRMWTDIGGWSERVLTRSDGPFRAWVAPRLASGKVEGVIAEAGGRPVGRYITEARKRYQSAYLASSSGAVVRLS